MAYQALYRRLRPQTFDGVIGQEHIIRTLKNQIANGRINHAYLFCGTRGTGKTSTAKIFARAINCEHTDGNIPCNECDVCRGILSGQNVNITEIDAASNNGIEMVRDITEEVKYPPTVGKYRVYIIDEVHMLSINAFNALLKTLEEPPEHVVFILATTDPQKLPVTVLSRCQRFDFHRISLREMTSVLMKFTKDEGVEADEEALSYISEISDGAMRDALSLLDMCMSFYFDECITAEKVRDITGAVDRSIFFEMTEAVAQNNSETALDLIDGLIANGRDILQFTSEYVRHLRNLLVARSVSGTCAALDYSESYIERLKTQAETLPYDYLIELINRFSQLQTGLKYSQDPRIMLEVAFISACFPMTEKSNAAIEKRLSNVEQRLENAPAVQYVQAAEEKKETVKRDFFQKAIPDDIKAVIANWDDFVETVDEVPLNAFLEKAHPASMGDDDILLLICEHSVELNFIESRKDDVIKALEVFSEKTIKVKTMLRSEYDKLHADKYGAADAEIMAANSEEKLSSLNFDIEYR